MRVGLVVAGSLLLSACGPGREPARARLEVQREHLEASLDRLEARLLDGRARVAAWQDLRARHARVSAVACEVNASHVADMARVEAEEREQARAGAARLAAAALPRGGGVPLPSAPIPEAAPGVAGAGGD